MKNTLSIFSVVAMTATLGACSFVKPEYGAEDVAVVKEIHVKDCKKLGKVYSNTTHKLLGIHRKKSKVAYELLTLAKNEAYGMGGDTLVEITGPANGEQSFTAYKCSK